MGGVFKSEAEAFESIEASLAQITAQFTAVEQSHKDRLEGTLAENAALHLNLHLLEAGQAFAKEVMSFICLTTLGKLMQKLPCLHWTR